MPDDDDDSESENDDETSQTSNRKKHTKEFLPVYGTLPPKAKL